METPAASAVRAMFDDDPAAQSLGLELVSVARGRVELSCAVKDFMINGLGVVHGGYLFLLADTAFAYCCVSLDRPSATRTAEIAYLTASGGRELIATAVVKQQSGRTTLCDVAITDSDGTPLAEFRGHGALAPAGIHPKLRTK